MKSYVHIQWLVGKECYVVWDEVAMPLGYYDTKEEAEIAFEEYCHELFSEEEEG